MNTLKKLLFIPLIIILSSCSIGSDFGDPVVFVKEFDLKDGGDLNVKTSGGSIKVLGEEGLSKAHVTVKVNGQGLSGRLSDAQIEELIEELDLLMESSGNSLNLNYQSNQKSGSFWKTNWRSVSFEVRVPAKIHTYLSTSGGSINISDMQGNHSIKTSGGSLRIENIKGEIEGRTSGGSIRVMGTNGNANVSTSGGSITIDNSHGNILAKTSGGSIKLMSSSGDIDARTSGGSIKAERLSELRSLALKTSGGSITAELESASSYDLQAKGSSVKLNSSSNFNGEISRDKVSGRWNEGGSKVSLNTSAGSVRINFY
jgi:hypothetical protein